jgi:hydroxyacylglutathione hydrolase
LTQLILLMKDYLFVLVLLWMGAYKLSAQSIDLEKIQWIHGSESCSQIKEAGLQVIRYDATTYIIRQNKCLNYEAPFLYLFIGLEKALLVDTGAEASDAAFPLYKTISKILKEGRSEPVPLVVIHTHGHGDHNAGDHQFASKPNVRLVPAQKDSIIDFFKLKDWPNTQITFDLGSRELIIIPIPGHDEQSIALYDPQTKWLLTVDTIYPGRLYVRNGKAFRESIARLYAFSKTHRIDYLMGNHIEMTRTNGIDYPTGTTYQPNEHALPLGLGTLEELHKACEKMGNTISHQVHDDFIIVPR